MPQFRKIPIPALILCAAVAASVQAYAGPANAKDETVRLARYYENLAMGTLSRYYQEATFLVKAKVETEPPPEFDLSGDDPDASGEVAPEQLPGLPFLPEDMQPAEPAPAGNGAGKENAAPSITLDVLVDTGYSDKDLDFIRNLLLMAARLDELKGDRVAVHEGVFPRDDRSLLGHRKPVDLPPAPKAAADSAAGAKPGGKDEKKEPANPFSAYLDHLPSLIPLLLICLLILACVWMVSRAMMGSSQAGRKSKAIAPVPESSPAPAPPQRAEPGKVQPTEIAVFRPFLLNCFVGSPKHCGQIIKSWIQRDPDKGMRDASAMIASLDRRLMGVLAPELGRESPQKLEAHLNAGETLPPEELLTIYKEFKREYDNLSNGAMEGDHYRDLFGFLLQMNEHQIMHILRDESMGIVGLVLAQLPGDISSGILQKTDPDNRAKLLIAMGNIDHIPLNVYKEIADRLSLKALEVGNMRYVAADGVDSILELIDSLPLNLQFTYIHSISEMDLGLGEKLRNRYVTLPEIVGLPDRFLGKILQGLDQETLILALLHLDDAIRAKVMSLLPERMQMMVSGGLDGARGATPKESESAQRRLLHRIRDEIRHSGRPV